MLRGAIPARYVSAWMSDAEAPSPKPKRAYNYAARQATIARKREEAEAAAELAARTTTSREEVIAGLKHAIDLAIQKGNLTAVVSAWEKLGKAEAIFTDVQRVENRFQAMTPEAFLAEMRATIVNDDLVRETLRELIEEYDAQRGGPPSGRRGLVGGLGSATHALPAHAAPGSLSLRRTH